MFAKLINQLANRNSVKWLLTALLVIAGGLVAASETTERRIQISLSLFPRIVAVDNDFRNKLRENKVARLVFVYVADQVKAEDLAAQLKASNSNVAAHSLETTSATVAQQIQPQSPIPTAIFITERLAEAEFAQILSYASANHIVMFSPFSGDVERGAMVGISVTSRVRPYFNVRSLEQAGIAINAVLMKMSVRYE